jgi:hypothetical protein
MRYERRAAVAVLVALVVTVLSAIPALRLAGDLVFLALLFIAIVLLALPSGRGTLRPLRLSPGMWLACALLAASLIVSPRWPVIVITLRTLGVVALIEALAAARGRGATATSEAEPPGR